MKTIAFSIAIISLLFVSSCSKSSATASTVPTMVSQDIHFRLKNNLTIDVSLSVSDLSSSWERRSPMHVTGGKNPTYEEGSWSSMTIRTYDIGHAAIGIVIEEVDSNGEEVAMIRLTPQESNAVRKGDDVGIVLSDSGIGIEHAGSTRKINWIISPSDWKSASVPRTGP